MERERMFPRLDDPESKQAADIANLERQLDDPDTPAEVKEIALRKLAEIKGLSESEDAES